MFISYTCKCNQTCTRLLQIRILIAFTLFFFNYIIRSVTDSNHLFHFWHFTEHSFSEIRRVFDVTATVVGALETSSLSLGHKSPATVARVKRPECHELCHCSSRSGLSYIDLPVTICPVPIASCNEVKTMKRELV
jgi:hypothetical protein